MMELLIACALLVILLTGLLTVVSHSSNLWQRSEEAIIRRHASRVAQEIVFKDLHQLLYTVARSSEIQCVINPSWITSPIKNADSFFWMASTPLLKGEGAGDTVGIGYFVIWLPNSLGSKAYLMRYRVPFSRDMIAAIEENPQSWISETEITQMQGDGDKSNLQGVVAENVIGLWVHLYDSSGVKIPVTRGTMVRPGEDVSPSQIEIEMVFLAPSVARRLEDPTSITAHYSSASATAFCENLPEDIANATFVVRCRTATHAFDE